MKSLFLSLCLLLSASAMASDCFKLDSQPTVLRTLSAPTEVCLSHMLTMNGTLTAKMTIDGKTQDISVRITDRTSLGGHFDSAKAMVYSNATRTRYCEEIDMIALTINLTMDIDGGLVGVNGLDGVAGYTPDICHSQATTEEVIYTSI